MQIYHLEYLVIQNTSTTAYSNYIQRIDELYLNIFTLLVKISKHDPKLALLAKVMGAVDIVIENLKRWFERKDIPPLLLAFNLLKIFSTKIGKHFMLCNSRKHYYYYSKEFDTTDNRINSKNTTYEYEK